MTVRNGQHLLTSTIPSSLIAPCGMNCRRCRAYAREKKLCPGCRGSDEFKSKTRRECHIKNCEKMADTEARYCFGCDSFPCDGLNHLDKRYRTQYGMSMIDNLENIRKLGVRHFLRNEKKRWTCPGCGKMLCVHESQCIYCRRTWR